MDEVEVTETSTTDPTSLDVRLPDGSTRSKAIPLTNVLEWTGGRYVTDVDNPQVPGGKLRIDLSPFQGRDPSTVYVEVSFSFVDPNKVGRKPPLDRG